MNKVSDTMKDEAWIRKLLRSLLSFRHDLIDIGVMDLPISEQDTIVLFSQLDSSIQMLQNVLGIRESLVLEGLMLCFSDDENIDEEEGGFEEIYLPTMFEGVAFIETVWLKRLSRYYDEEGYDQRKQRVVNEVYDFMKKVTQECDHSFTKTEIEQIFRNMEVNQNDVESQI